MVNKAPHKGDRFFKNKEQRFYPETETKISSVMWASVHDNTPPSGTERMIQPLLTSALDECRQSDLRSGHITTRDSVLTGYWLGS
jgi:hypothetical protein